MNTSPERLQEEPQKSHQQELFKKLSHFRGVLRELLIEITRSGVKQSIEDLEMDLLFKAFAEEFGFGKVVDREQKRNDLEMVRDIKKRLQQLSREITTLLRTPGENQRWSKGQMAKARLLLYRVEEYVREI